MMRAAYGPIKSFRTRHGAPARKERSVYVFILTNGASVEVDLEIDPLDVEHCLREGRWFTDQEGYLVNPAHVVRFKPPEMQL